MNSQSDPKPKDGIWSSLARRYNEYRENEKKEEAELDEIKVSLLEQCHSPRAFRDAITGSQLESPQLLPCGHCCSKVLIGIMEKIICPEHGEQDINQAVSSPTLDSIINKVQLYLKELRREIAAIKSKDKVPGVTQKVTALKGWLESNINQYNEYKKLLLSRQILKLQILQAYDDIPKDFLDPIDLALFREPILTPHGYIFSQHSIEQYLMSNNRCPMSRKPLRLEDIRDRKGEEAKLQSEAQELIRSFNKDRAQFQLIPLDEKSIPAEVKAYKERVKEKTAQLENIKERMRLTVFRAELSVSFHYNLGPFLEWQPAALYLQIGPNNIVEDKEITRCFHTLQEEGHKLNARIIEAKLSDEKPLDEAIKKLQDSIDGLLQKKNEAESTQKRTLNLRLRLSNSLREEVGSFLECQPAALYLQIGSNNIVEDKEITQNLLSLKQAANMLHARIIESKESDEKALENEIKNLKIGIAGLVKKQKETEKIQKIIYNLKIDQKNEENLQAWSEENDPCTCWRGGVKVDYPVPNREEVRTYRVPTRIKVLMQIASSAKNYKTAAEFIQAIKNAKSMPSSWNNPFSWYTRKAQTTLLYNSETNVETFRFTRAPRRS